MDPVNLGWKMRKRRWLWVVLFIWLALLLAFLATGWNVLVVQDYRRMLELAKQVSGSGGITVPRLPAASLAIGWLGFTAALGTIVLFFLKVLKEMRLNQMQSEFLASVSHELKTPIASIELSSSLIRGGGLSSEELARLWSAHDLELRRLRDEVNTLLEAARMDAAPMRILRTQPVSLEAWIAGSQGRWSRILGPGSKLAREGDPLIGEVRLDRKALDLIADNLVDNARKFSRGAPELVVSTRRIPARAPWRRARWEIEFRDQGWGFDPAEARRIFSRFARARTEAPYSIPGSGLGLYLADSGSRALGLRLRGESAGPGRGARFILQGTESAPSRKRAGASEAPR